METSDKTLATKPALRDNVIVSTPNMVADCLHALKPGPGLHGSLAGLHSGSLNPHERVLKSLRRQCETLCTEELPWLSASAKELIMGRALCAWLDWKLPG